ncbi:MAG: Lpg1974 family pore-forming outer membrane protein [Pirellulaceae bacterium]
MNTPCAIGRRLTGVFFFGCAVLVTASACGQQANSQLYYHDDRVAPIAFSATDPGWQQVSFQQQPPTQQLPNQLEEIPTGQPQVSPPQVGGPTGPLFGQQPAGPSPQYRQAHPGYPYPSGCDSPGCGPAGCGPACTGHGGYMQRGYGTSLGMFGQCGASFFKRGVQGLGCGLRGVGHRVSGRHTGDWLSGLYFGAGIVLAKPHFKEAFKVSRLDTRNGVQSLIPFSYDYEVTPRLWLGLEKPSGLGIRADYWEFDHAGQEITAQSDGLNIYGAHAVTIIFPANIIAAAPGDTLFSTDRLRTQIFNLHGTMRARIGRAVGRISGGLRYASLTQTLSSRVTPAPGQTAGIPSQLTWERNFEGTGPAASADFRIPFGCCGLAATGNAGGSLLFGDKSINRFVIGDVGVPPAPPLLNLIDADEVVGVFDMGFGMEWRRQMRSGGLLSIYGRYEGQLWAEAGAPTLGFLGFEGYGLGVDVRR